jgi:hypothetical protein
MFANLAKHPIPNNDIFDMGILVMNHTSLIAEESKAWTTRGNNSTNTMDFATFRTFWEPTSTLCPS